ncbi:MAG TPA: DNA polymerase II, partial [Thermoprotei archaeon]|nr:DNA polymerase II [Thermoprotei archaeon]
MGRTQPSLTAVVDHELNKFERVSSRLKDEKLRARVRALRRRVREVEGALE